MRIGIGELLLVFAVALFVVGPDRLPSFARKFGEALAQFRKYAAEATKDIKESVVDPLEDAQKPFREAVEPLQNLDRTVRDQVKEVQDAFAGIGKTQNYKKAEDISVQETSEELQEVEPLEQSDEDAARTVRSHSIEEEESV